MSPRTVFLFLWLLFCVLHGKSTHDPRVASGRIKMREACSKPPHFVLVHGYNGGAWSWYKVMALMQVSGYKVDSIDLKGAGVSPYDTHQVRTFDTYNEPLITFLANLKDDEKVILVGYSAGGLSVTDASHKFSKKIQVAVYVAATMLKHGFVTPQDYQDGAPQPGPPHGGGNTSTESQHQICPSIISQEDATLVQTLFRQGPIQAILQARFKGGGAERVPRVYIKTTNDHVLKPEQQDAMIKRWPPVEVYAMETDHGLLATDPFALFGLLVKVAVSTECN